MSFDQDIFQELLFVTAVVENGLCTVEYAKPCDCCLDCVSWEDHI